MEPFSPSRRLGVPLSPTPFSSPSDPADSPASLVADAPTSSQFLMVGSTAAPPPSSHPHRPAGIVDGEAFPPPPDGPPSPTATGVSSPSFVHIGAQDHPQLQDRLIRVMVEEVSEDGNVQTQGGVGGALQGRKKGATMTPGKCSEDGNVQTQGVSLPSTSARPTSSTRPSLSSKNKGSQPAANDNLQVPKTRAKILRLPVVRSPGVNHMLSQESPRTICVKRSTPTSQFSEMDDQQSNHTHTIEREALERILSDANAEPIQISYQFVKSITKNFSEVIGRGGFGEVYLGFHRNEKKVAVKKIFGSQDFSDKPFLDEINCLMMVKHKNIARFLAYCAETKEQLIKHEGRFILADVRQRFLCFEYVPNGTLDAYLKDNCRGDDWQTRYQMIIGVCQGLNYLHQKRINHLDLKPENILLDGLLEPKITDFGLSRVFGEGQSRIITKSIFGTLGYIAPEILQNGEISFKADVYSLGSIIIKLLTGRDKYDYENWHKSLDMENPQLKSCMQIARNCGHNNQHKRPSISEILCQLKDMESIAENASWVNQELRNGRQLSSIYQLSPVAYSVEPREGSMGGSRSRSESRDGSSGRGRYAHSGSFQQPAAPQYPSAYQPYGAPPQQGGYAAPYPAYQPAPVATPQPPPARGGGAFKSPRLDRRYSRIADYFQSVEQVTYALAQAGLESSNLIVGIDFTKSNEWTGKFSFHGRSLHHISNVPNPYEQGISILGQTLSKFDEDNLIPCFGFGDASTHDQDVFCFYPDERPCNGFSEALERYRELVPHLRLAGPTSFAPIIEMAMTIVEQSGGQYHVLLIIADGQVTRSVDTASGQLSAQEQKTVDAIVRASELPLSIVLVGVGDGPWDMMKEFDDNIPARAFDNFQFVKFSEIMSKNVPQSRKEAAFALSALMEIPQQYKATVELGILGRRSMKAPVRVPLPPPTGSHDAYSYGAKSFSKPTTSSSYPPYETAQTAAPAAPSSAYDNQVCHICLVNPKDMAFGCGHQTCCECGQTLQSCPICRTQISTRIKLY